ncbi:MAG TPA: anti-repressor SinI family protein [Metabacillus sp.]|nr:anti-repressor SinI family protein [Metabacillus sp.]
MTEVKEQYAKNQIDSEWVALIQEAKQIGLSFDQIQAFLQQGGTSEE